MKVSIYTDGAARGNPDGPGGYGVVLEYVLPEIVYATETAVGEHDDVEE